MVRGIDIQLGSERRQFATAKLRTPITAQFDRPVTAIVVTDHYATGPSL